MLRVVTPMALSTLVTLALLHGAGVALNLFHLIALVLAAGLGLDYGLFLERASHESVAHRRALHTVTICATAACVVFAVLGSSALPVLRSIGITVVLGVASNFVLSQLLIRRAADR
jgi:predicted exporter